MPSRRLRIGGCDGKEETAATPNYRRRNNHGDFADDRRTVMKRFLGKTTDNFEVILDDDSTNVEYHLLETPNLLDLVAEALPAIETLEQDQVVIERDLGRNVGTTNLVETSEGDKIVYAKRKGRDVYNRFVKGKEITPTSYIVVVLRKVGDGYILWTAMCGRLLPPEAYDQNSEWSKTHAMVFDENLIQMDTLRDTLEW